MTFCDILIVILYQEVLILHILDYKIATLITDVGHFRFVFHLVYYWLCLSAGATTLKSENDEF